MDRSEVITPQPLTRKAVIYMRQSPPLHASSHQESLRLQDALTARARALGWPPDAMEVVDTDVGQSAASPSPRAGFNTLGGQITWGQVGLILAAEATRLARHGSDGDPRLALCGDKGGLMAEGDGLDDPSTANGRLLLGWQGPRSEWALHTIRARLSAGLLNKAARGDRVLTVPTGREREAPGHVRTAAHLAVHARLRLVFTTFLPRRSASQVRAFFKAHGLRLPRRERLGAVGWTRPTVAAILALLQHPAYAGAFP